MTIPFSSGLIDGLKDRSVRSFQFREQVIGGIPAAKVVGILDSVDSTNGTRPSSFYSHRHEEWLWSESSKGQNVANDDTTT